MPLQIVRENIVHMDTDAIVNAANSQLLPGGGVCGSVFDAAGIQKMKKACERIGRCEIGSAVITKGFDLKSKYVIHAVGPVWNGGNFGEEKLLRSCYKAALLLAKKYKLNSIAFPLISSGIFGYPKAQALSVAVSEISNFLMENEMLVYIVVYDKGSFQLSKQLFDSVSSYIDDKYVESRAELRHLMPNMMLFNNIPNKCADYSAKRNLEDVLTELDETFSESLLRLIDEKGKSDVEIYKKANIDRKHFSKIRSNKDYKPTKATVLAFAIALELSLDETKDLLLRAGFALSHSNKFDIVIEFFIQDNNYDIFEINNTLFAFNLPILA